MISRFELFTMAIFSIHRSVQKIQRVEMAKYGLKGPHAQCLLAMVRCPQGVTAAQLCELCDKDKAAISRTVAELEKAGLISRADRAGKRYRSCLKLTPEGVQAAQAVTERVKVAVHQASAGYGQEDREIFCNVLGMIADNLRVICRDGLQENETNPGGSV